FESGTPGKFTLQGAQPKTFACGWAPEEENGRWGWVYTHNYNYADHCNLQFKLYERKLVGRLVNPSFPNDPEKWEEVVEIPINNHFYYESARDAYGRDTSAKSENSARSHWEARPWMSLDLSRIQIKN